MNRKITFQAGKTSQLANPTQTKVTPSPATQHGKKSNIGLSNPSLPGKAHGDTTARTLANAVNQGPDELYKERPQPIYHFGQGLPPERRRLGTLRHGFERLGHMYTLGIPYKFEEFQGRHPLDFLEETREHYKLHPDPVKKPATPEDTSLFDVRHWLEPLIRKGQLYWDYCRDKWVEKEAAIGATCAPISCIFSLWSFTEGLFLYGYVFVAVYLVVTAIFIVPIIYMELILGQFHRQGLVKAIRQTCPLFRGIAYLMLTSSLFDYLLSMTRMTWLVYYLFQSKKENYNWKNCDGHRWISKNTDLCRQVHYHTTNQSTLYDGQYTPTVEFFRLHVLRPWGHWEVPEGNNTGDPTVLQIILGILPDPPIFLCYALLLVVFRQLLKRDCTSLGTGMGYVFYSAFMFSGFTLLAFSNFFSYEVVLTACRYFFKENYFKEMLGNNMVWTTAVRHAVIGSGVGTGFYVTAGSHHTFPHDALKSLAILSGFTSCVVHICIGIFFILCYFTIITTSAFQGNASSLNYGSDYVYELFPHVVVQHPNPAMAHVLCFGGFFAILLLSSGRVLAALHTLRQYFFDKRKDYYDPCRVNYNYWEHDQRQRYQRFVDRHLAPKRKSWFVTKLMAICSIFHILTLFAGGSIVLMLMETYWYSYMPMVIILIECFAIFFFAGVRTLNEYVRKMTTWQVTLWYRFAWKVWVPAVLVYYFTHPPRIVERIGGDVVRLIGYILVAVPFFFMYMSVLHVWRKSRAKQFCNKFLLEATPEYEHKGMIEGRKPSTRLHWMHHLQVPAGVNRGLCFPSYERPPLKPDPYRFEGNNMLMNFLWYTCGLGWLLNGIRDTCVDYPDKENLTALHFHMFPPMPFPMKPPKKEKKAPEYLPNQAIKRVHRLKKYKDWMKQRKLWLEQKVVLEEERFAQERDSRDIETGIMSQTTKEAQVAYAEDEENEFFVMFDMSTGEENGASTSTTEESDSFDDSSDDGRGRYSSASVSTAESFDSANSVFRWSEDDQHHKSNRKRKKSSNSSSDEQNKRESEEDDDDLEWRDDEIPAPAQDFADQVPFDDETDSWDLEDLEDLEVIMEGGVEEDNSLSSDQETDTDELMGLEGESGESGVSGDESSEEEEEEAMEEKNKEDAKTDGNGGSEETDSWTLSCGSSSSCNSGDSSGDMEDSEDEDDDDGKRKFSMASSSEYAKSWKKRPDQDLKFFRHMAEKIETFLTLSKKKEVERVDLRHEQKEHIKKLNEEAEQNEQK